MPALWLTLLALAAASLYAWVARARGPRIGLLFAGATLLLGLAALDPPSPFRDRPHVNLLVDLSPSTRGMWFRDAKAIREVRSRLGAHADVDVFGFAEGDPVRLDLDHPVPEIDSTRTTLPERDATPIVLLSDGQILEPTSRGPVFPIVDPAGAPVADSRIVALAVERGTAIARTHAHARGGEIVWPDGSRDRVAPGDASMRHPLGSSTGTVVASLTPGDAWPENDRLETAAAPAAGSRLWIGADAPTGFRTASSESLDLPTVASASVIVLNNVPIAAIPNSTQQALARYVRDFGGSVVLGGGPAAMGAGGYGNSTLDALSPLASLPPAPNNELFILVDASGSMSGAVAPGRSRLDAAVDAALAIDRIVPETWPVRVGSIARDLRWWPLDPDAPARPADLLASGPTNLAAGIGQVMALPAQHTKRLIVISDGQVPAESLAGLDPAASGLVLDWLALPPADADGPLAALVRSSGGVVMEAGDAASWRGQAEALARSALATPMIEGPFTFALEPVGAVRVDAINGAFLREGATSLAGVRVEQDSRAVAATWNVGLGKVTTLAFALDPAKLGAFAVANERPPRDPRFRLVVTAESIDLHALDAGGPMNRLTLSLDLEGVPLPFEQIAPGHYRAGFPREGRPRAGSLRLDEVRLETVLVPASYPREFESIGLDVAALERLARSTGGRTVEREKLGSIDLGGPRRRLRLPLTLAGAALLVGALVVGRSARMP